MNLLLLLDGPTLAAAATAAAKSAIADKRQAYTLAFIGLAGSLIPVILNWTKDIDITSKRLKQLDEGVKRIAFWEQWLKLSSLMGEEAADLARKRVRQELDLLCTALSTSAAQFHSEASALLELKSQFKSKLAGLSSVQRLLLFYKPSTAMAWFPRFFFYIFALLTSFAVLFLCIEPFSGDKDKSTIMVGGIFFTFITFLASVGFRYLSIALEKPHNQMVEVAPDLPIIPSL